MIVCALNYGAMISELTCLARRRKALETGGSGRPGKFNYIGLEKCLECEKGNEIQSAAPPFDGVEMQSEGKGEKKMEGLRACKKCGMEKLLSGFGKNRRMKDGIHHMCMECSRAQRNESNRRCRMNEPKKASIPKIKPASSPETSRKPDSKDTWEEPVHPNQDLCETSLEKAVAELSLAYNIVKNERRMDSAFSIAAALAETVSCLHERKRMSPTSGI